MKKIYMLMILGLAIMSSTNAQVNLDITGTATFDTIQLGDNPFEGHIKYQGGNFYGYDGSNWKILSQTDKIIDEDSDTKVEALNYTFYSDRIKMSIEGNEVFTFGISPSPKNKPLISIDHGTDVYIGRHVGVNDTGSLSSSNTAIGTYSMNQNETGKYNTVLGYAANGTNVIGDRNTALGYYALQSNKVDANTAIGNRSMTFNETGENNVAIGSQSLFLGTSPKSNVAVGSSSLRNSDGEYNVAVGSNSLERNTFGDNNIALGSYSLSNNKSGSNNISIGHSSGQLDSMSMANVYIGYRAGRGIFNSHGQAENVVVGYEAGYKLDGVQNTFIGINSGYSNTHNNNTFLGANSGKNNNGRSNVFIGNEAGKNESGNAKLYISNSDADENNALIYGNFDTKILNINGDVTTQELIVEENIHAKKTIYIEEFASLKPLATAPTGSLGIGTLYVDTGACCGNPGYLILRFWNGFTWVNLN